MLKLANDNVNELEIYDKHVGVTYSQRSDACRAQIVGMMSLEPRSIMHT